MATDQSSKAPLAGKVDHYGGFIVDSKTLPNTVEQFTKDLKDSLDIWKEEKRRGIWLKIRIENSAFIPIAVEHGFVFHHAQKDYVTLTKWLPESRNTLPGFANHYIGVGGLVLNSKGEVLVVKEKNGPIRGFWKIPGGMVDPGEDLVEAVKREVLEETGIKSEVVSMLCFRHAKDMNFGMSDIYFVFRLNALTEEIKMQEEEIAACKWMPAEEFRTIGKFEGLWKKVMQIQVANVDGVYEGFDVESLPHGFKPGNGFLFHGVGSRL